MRQSAQPRLGNQFVIVIIITAVICIAVLMILAVLMALLFPAVSRVREAASRTQTNNNLRQCAIAVHNYESVYRRLPDAAGPAVRPPYADVGEERSMWFHLMPYLEADNHYKNNVHDAVVNSFLAPADPFITTADGKLNFAGNIRIFGYKTLGPAEANNAVDDLQGRPSGRTLASVLAPNMVSGMSLSRIADGASNTFMIATRYAECGAQPHITAYSASPTGTPLVGGGPMPSFGVASAAGKGGFFGAGAHDKPAGRTSNRATFQPAPHVKECLADDAVFGHSFGGGISIALCDATVRSVDPSMSATTFCRALCPGDGFPLEDDWGGF
jgi:type II secretory pathway pseudopilin PulG